MSESNEQQIEPTESSEGESSQPSDPDSGSPEQTAQTVSKEEYERLQSQYSQLETAVNQYFQNQANSQNAAQPGQPAGQNPQPEPDLDYDELSDEWLTDPGKASQRLSQNIESKLQNYINQVSQPLLQSNEAMARQVASQDPKTREVFDKYGSEVQSYVRNMNPVHRTNPELWKKAAQMVRADHFDEFVNEKAQELAAGLQSQTETGSGSGAGSSRSPSMKEDLREKLESSAHGQKLLQRYGSPEGLRTHVNQIKDKLGVKNFEEYVNMVSDTNTIHDPGSPDKWKNRDLVRDAD